MANLVELDSIEVLVIIDNELDPISPCPNAAVQQSGGIKDIGLLGRHLPSDERGGAIREWSMSDFCCSAHGLSLMITGFKGDQRHTILFDAGPEASAFERNATRLRADLGKIETVQLSHWHVDHSGGMLKALQMITDAREKAADSHPSMPVQVDLHPARPDYRGFRPPEAPVFSMEADPSFEEIAKVRGDVKKHDEPHNVLDNMFLVSGEIPRVTTYENGLKFSVRYDKQTKEWQNDEKMADERFLMCKLKDRGIVMFTGCSHAGVVNASRHAVELGKGTPLYAVMGGFHLADAEPATIEASVRDLRALDAKVLLAGHCTGWRAKFELQSAMPPGCFVPSFVGSKFVL